MLIIVGCSLITQLPSLPNVQFRYNECLTSRQNVAGAQDYFQRRIDFITRNIEEVQKNLQEKHMIRESE